MASSLETTNLMILWLFTLQLLLTNYLLHILKIMRWTKKTIKPPGHSVSGLNVLFHTHKHHLINRFIWSWHHYFKFEIGNRAKTLNVKRKYWKVLSSIKYVATVTRWFCTSHTPSWLIFWPLLIFWSHKWTWTDEKWNAILVSKLQSLLYGYNA